MRARGPISCLLVAGLTLISGTGSAAETDKAPKTQPDQGMTLEDIGRGLKSAAKNIEQEIPKMGAAIGHAVKKVTEQAPSKSTEDKPAKPVK